MIDVKDRPLEWYVEALKKRKYFSFPRFGDGDWIAITRGKGALRGGGFLQTITPEIQKDMIRTLLRFALTPGIIFGMQRNTMRIRGLRGSVEQFISEHKLNIPWVLADVFHYASRDGLLYPLLKQLRKMRVVVIGPCFLLSGQSELFKYHALVKVPPGECYLDKIRVISDILSLHRETPKDIVYAFSCGFLARVLIPELHERMAGNFLIDFGSLWDVFCGSRSRRYTKDRAYTREIYYRNLWGTA